MKKFFYIVFLCVAVCSTQFVYAQGLSGVDLDRVATLGWQVFDQQPKVNATYAQTFVIDDFAVALHQQILSDGTRALCVEVHEDTVQLQTAFAFQYAESGLVEASVVTLSGVYNGKLHGTEYVWRTHSWEAHDFIITNNPAYKMIPIKEMHQCIAVLTMGFDDLHFDFAKTRIVSTTHLQDQTAVFGYVSELQELFRQKL